MAYNNNRRIDRGEMEKVLKVDSNKKHIKKLSGFKLALSIIGAIIAVAYILALIIGRFVIPTDAAIYPFYQSFDIFSKDNPQPYIRLASYVLLTITAGTILRVTLRQLSKNKKITKKTGIAILQLFESLVKYVAFIIIICIALTAFGIDAAGIFAGLGIIAMIIGLGMTSLIEDIVAGVFIIAERLFDVGDIIVLDGFRGTVTQIGIRSTKIADVGNDVLIVRNSSIGSLVNLTANLSSAAITIPIAPKESIEHVDEVVKNAHIEYICEKYEKVETGPYYLGLYEITSKGVQNVMVVAGCKEDNKYEVERILFLEMKLIFEANGIEIGNPGLYMDQEQ